MSKCDTCVNKPTEMTHCHLCLIREILTFKAENEQLQAELAEKQLLLDAHIVANRQFEEENKKLQRKMEY